MVTWMRGLSVQQPWAAAIAYGPKTVENRTWPAPGWALRTMIAIHASKKPDISARPPDGESWPMAQRMHLGAVIAVATLAGCHLSPDFGGICGATRPLCSPWSARDQYHWLLADVRPLPEPVPCRGMLGLWRLPENVEKAVRARLEEQ
jgi:ASCH domain